MPRGVSQQHQQSTLLHQGSLPQGFMQPPGAGGGLMRQTTIAAAAAEIGGLSHQSTLGIAASMFPDAQTGGAPLRALSGAEQAPRGHSSPAAFTQVLAAPPQKGMYEADPSVMLRWMNTVALQLDDVLEDTVSSPTAAGAAAAAAAATQPASRAASGAEPTAVVAAAGDGGNHTGTDKEASDAAAVEAAAAEPQPAAPNPQGSLGIPIPISPSARFQTLLVNARRTNDVQAFYEAMLSRYMFFQDKPATLLQKMADFVRAAVYDDMKPCHAWCCIGAPQPPPATAAAG
jgi:fermentation-respiration switch protein FrsA (DUF1100 family)